MDWLTVPGYEAARPDPLADAAPGIIEHMNRDHADALVLYARVLGALPATEAAEMVAVDRLGFKLRVRAADGAARPPDRLSARGHQPPSSAGRC